MGYAINYADCTPQSSKGTITNYTHSTTCRKYLTVHGELNAPLPSPMEGILKTSFLSSVDQAYTLNSRKATKGRLLFLYFGEAISGHFRCENDDRDCARGAFLNLRNA